MSLNPPIRDWAGKRVWIVGASSGIGAALAAELGARGAQLCLSARAGDKLEAVRARIETAFSVPLDVRSSDDWSRAMRQVATRWDAIDVLVLNAGLYEPLRAWELNEAAARRTIETNVLGVMMGVAALLPAMFAAQRSHIVIMGSVAGYAGLPKALVYGASKAALRIFTEALYLDLKPRGIGVSLVSPGFVRTPATAQNDFKMPALIDADQAARAILQGLARGSFEIHFPKRFTLLMKLLALLPYKAYFWLVSKGTGL